MGAFYLILMVALGLGLLRLHSPGAGETGGRDGHRGWAAFTRHVLATTIGGYLLLLAVVTGYYYGIARVAAFWPSAVTGTALLIAITMPVFAAASWLSTRARRPRQRRPGQGPPSRQ